MSARGGEGVLGPTLRNIRNARVESALQASLLQTCRVWLEMDKVWGLSCFIRCLKKIQIDSDLLSFNTKKKVKFAGDLFFSGTFRCTGCGSVCRG